MFILQIWIKRWLSLETDVKYKNENDETQTYEIRLNIEFKGFFEELNKSYKIRHKTLYSSDNKISDSISNLSFLCFFNFFNFFSDKDKLKVKYICMHNYNLYYISKAVNF